MAVVVACIRTAVPPATPCSSVMCAADWLYSIAACVRLSGPISVAKQRRRMTRSSDRVSRASTCSFSFSFSFTAAEQRALPGCVTASGACVEYTTRCPKNIPVIIMHVASPGSTSAAAANNLVPTSCQGKKTISPRYKDGSAARGTVGTDSATIALSGRRAATKTKLRGVVLGCTTSYNGDSFLASDGVLSLGYSNISFASRAAARFGGRFSYCLVDHLAPRNQTSYLTFGPNPAVISPRPPPRPASHKPHPACGSSAPPAAVPGSRQTPLLLDRRTNPFYAVTVNGVSVDGELLKIPRRVWDVERGGGTILDSGTSLTVLATPAYRAVVAALSRKLDGVPRVTMDPFDYCYNWTSPSTGQDLDVPVPKLEVHFAGSARLEPPPKSYVIDAAPGVKCIGLQEGEWPGISVIGNILQQEHLWEFDLKNRRLRFQRSRCTH